MFTSITKDQFNAYHAKGYNRIPLLVEASSDLDSPLSIFTKLANQPFSYLLESVEGGDKFGRYSIVGLPSKTQIKIHKNAVSIYDQGQLKDKFDHKNPLDFIEEFMGNFKVPTDLTMPRYSGGLAGYFGYETINYIEPRLCKDFLQDALNVPDILLMLSDEVVVIDNLLGKLFIINYLDPSQEDAYENGALRLSAYLKQLKNKPLGCWTIDTLLKSKKISKVLVTSTDQKILDFLKKRYKSKILLLKRNLSLGRINVPLDETIKKSLKYAKSKKIKFNYVFQISYKTPFLKSNDLDSFVYMMEFFKTDEVLGVRAETDRMYKHNGASLDLLNESSNLKLERDEIYRCISGIRLFKKNLNKNKIKKPILGHYILDQKSSHIINTELDWKIASSI